MTIGKRISQARIAAKLTKSELARACGLTPSSVTQWENGQTKSIEGANLIKIAMAAHVDPVWLATGKGAMYANEQTKVNSTDTEIGAIPTPRTENDDIQAELMRFFGALSPRGKSAVLAEAYRLYLDERVPRSFGPGAITIDEDGIHGPGHSHKRAQRK